MKPERLDPDIEIQTEWSAAYLEEEQNSTEFQSVARGFPIFLCYKETREITREAL